MCLHNVFPFDKWTNYFNESIADKVKKDEDIFLNLDNEKCGWIYTIDICESVEYMYLVYRSSWEVLNSAVYNVA